MSEVVRSNLKLEPLTFRPYSHTACWVRRIQAGATGYLTHTLSRALCYSGDCNRKNKSRDMKPFAYQVEGYTRDGEEDIFIA